MSISAYRLGFQLTMALLLLLPFLVTGCKVGTRENVTSNSNTAKSSVSNNNTSFPAANPLLPIKTTHLTLTGKSSTVLTDARGFVLYYYTPDTLSKPACTGGCLKAWPPLLVDSQQKQISMTTLPGQFSIQKISAGDQVAYNGHLLYTYISDTHPGQVTGNGIYSWYAVTSDLK
ncbi:hypothetical protein [Ktedonobacter robiniae]|uniref:Lipoprotein n=1 Tax=Ktedonobacter robiniae TaxID=2778365 RepID=A0ABQ3UW23_9CHLR|nr:hypothetical protein [Ktedonobacter robiniae]GHO57026.1 hypothetical protein KSB_55010 [Ktedonobacter robiniae]